MEVTALCFRLLMLEIIQQVQESDAAFLRERSISVNITVTVSDPAVPDAPDGAPLVSVCRLISLAVVGTPYLLSTIILGLIYRDKRRARQLVAEDRSDDVIMEME